MVVVASNKPHATTSVLRRLYEPGDYYRRTLGYLRLSGRALRRHGLARLPRRAPTWADLLAGLRIAWKLGVLERGRLSFWGFLARVGLSRPGKLSSAMGFAAIGYHLHMVTERFLVQVNVAPVAPNHQFPLDKALGG